MQHDIKKHSIDPMKEILDMVDKYAIKHKLTHPRLEIFLDMSGSLRHGRNREAFTFKSITGLKKLLTD